MENKNDIKNLNNNEVKDLNDNEIEKVAGGLEPVDQRGGYTTKTTCYKCHKVFEEYIIPSRDSGYGFCLTICPECTRKLYAEHKNFNISIKELLKREER